MGNDKLSFINYVIIHTLRGYCRGSGAAEPKCTALSLRLNYKLCASNII